MLEADISEGDLSQVTTAIQNALRPSQPQTRIVQIAGPVAVDEDTQVEEVDGVEVDLEDGTVIETKRSRASTPRKRTFATPKVVEINWDVTPSIEAFTSAHPPKTIKDKFLAVIAWFKEAGIKDAVTPDDVYTVFRKLRWSTNIQDFSQPMRDLKGDQFITGGAKAGFAINHLGLDKVHKFAEAQ